MKRELFFVLLIVIGVVLFSYTLQSNAVEDFTNAAPSVNVPLTTPGQQPLCDGDPTPFAPPSVALLAPPPGQTASVNSYPAEDPALEKTTLVRIKNLQETLSGFLKNEASGLKATSDPNVQLPLESAKADLRRLTDEVSVLSRNPGVQSSLTQEDVNQIEGNLTFLQKKWRLSANALSGGPPPSEIEGFQGAPSSSPAPFSIWNSVKSFFGGKKSEGFQSLDLGSILSSMGIELPPDASGQNAIPIELVGSTDVSGNQTSGATGGNGYTGPINSCALGQYSKLSGKPCATAYYCDLSGVRCTFPNANCNAGKAECGTSSNDPGVTMNNSDFLKMLTAGKGSGSSGLGSGSSGWGSNGWNSAGTPSVSSKSPPATLIELKGLVAKISAEIIRLQTSGATDPLVAARVSALQSTSDSVADIIRNLESGAMDPENVPITQAALNAFLPVMKNMNTPLPNLISDSGQTSALNSLFPLYNAGDVSGASLSKALLSQYANIANNLSWNLSLTNGTPAEKQLVDAVATAAGGNQGLTQTEVTNAPPRGEFESAVQTMADQTPARLDWKTRAQQICEQVKRRNMNPYDYGCMKNTADVSETFSFRGYAKMICARLGTNYDPGIPELCGCPPPTWPGWRL